MRQSRIDLVPLADESLCGWFVSEKTQPRDGIIGIRRHCMKHHENVMICDESLVRCLYFHVLS